MQIAGKAMLKVREQIGLRVRLSIGVMCGAFFKALDMQHGGKRVFQEFQGILKLEQGFFQAGGRGNAGARFPGHPVRSEIRPPGDGQHGAGAEAAPAFPVKEGPALVIHKLGHGIGKMVFSRPRIGPVAPAYGVHVQHPARAQELDGVADLRRDVSPLVWIAGIRILAPGFPGSEKGAVLVEYDARRGQQRVGKQIGQDPWLWNGNRRASAWQTSTGKFLQVKIDRKLSKCYFTAMKTVKITMKAHKQIANLNKQDMASIYEVLEALAAWPDISGVKSLIDMPGYRLRVGQYRAMFEVSGEVITVTEVKRRNERTY
jgi:mRNA interferase RelE/StbE